ncbi:MAG: D-aminoacyl-tRNA deacylase [Eubacteriales bacterium]|nr:D-aminoacyl-tRNA deacylase [Eubacteriales bacterium]
MKFLVQRVTSAAVTVEGEVKGKIGKGFLVLAGVSDTDTKPLADKMLDKLSKLRIFEDSEGKTNLSIQDVGGEFLVISQFTLYANCKKGNRPSFIEAGKPDMAEEMYEYLVDSLRRRGFSVEKGVFGADMKVELLNDGPFTVMLDSKELGFEG